MLRLGWDAILLCAYFQARLMLVLGRETKLTNSSEAELDGVFVLEKWLKVYRMSHRNEPNLGTYTLSALKSIIMLMQLLYRRYFCNVLPGPLPFLTIHITWCSFCGPLFL